MCRSHHRAISAPITHCNASDFQYDDMRHSTNQFFILCGLSIYHRMNFSQLFASVWMYAAVHAQKSVVLVWVGTCLGQMNHPSTKTRINTTCTFGRRKLRLDLIPVTACLCAFVHVAAYFKIHVVLNIRKKKERKKTSSEQFRKKWQCTPGTERYRTISHEMQPCITLLWLCFAAHPHTLPPRPLRALSHIHIAWECFWETQTTMHTVQFL